MNEKLRKINELSRKISRCDSALNEAQQDLKSLEDALAIIQKKRDEAQEQVNYWELEKGDAEKEIDQVVRADEYEATA